MRTPEEFQKHVSCLIQQKKRRRRRCAAGVAALFVLAIALWAFWPRQAPLLAQSHSGESMLAGATESASMPSPLEKALKNEQTQCQLPQEVTLIVNNESRVIGDEQTLSSLCSLVLECSLNPDLEILEEDWEILFSYPNRTSTTLRFTQDGFFTADGTGYSPDNPEEWYQQLRSLVF